MRKDVYIAIGVGILVCFILLIGFLGSGWSTRADADSNVGFKPIDTTIHHVKIVYDIETGVMYTMSTTYNNIGSMTVMVSPDGTPRVYEGFVKP